MRKWRVNAAAAASSSKAERGACLTSPEPDEEAQGGSVGQTDRVASRQLTAALRRASRRWWDVRETCAFGCWVRLDRFWVVSGAVKSVFWTCEFIYQV